MNLIKKSIVAATTAIISLSSIPHALGAEAIALSGAKLELGVLKTDDLSPLNRTFTLKRTKATASKVAVTFTLKTMTKGCVDTDIEVTQIPEVKLQSCTANLNRGHDCEEVVFEAYQTARRVCKKEGLVLTESKQTIELNFKKAVVLTETADEIFELNIAQQSMNSGAFKLGAKATETDSVYNVKIGSDKVTFKAK